MSDHSPPPVRLIACLSILLLFAFPQVSHSKSAIGQLEDLTGQKIQRDPVGGRERPDPVRREPPEPVGSPVRTGPTSSDYVNQSTELIAQRRYLEAEEAARQALRLDPQNAVAYNNIGAALSWQGRYKEAAVAYRQALRLNPQLEIARKNLQLVEEGLKIQVQSPQRGDPDEVPIPWPLPSESLYVQSLYDSLTGFKLLEQKRYKKAEQYFRKAIAKNPTAAGYAALAQALGEQKRYQEELEALQKALNLSPGDIIYRERLKFLEREIEERKREARKGDSKEASEPEQVQSPPAVGKVDSQGAASKEAQIVKLRNDTQSLKIKVPPPMLDAQFSVQLQPEDQKSKYILLGTDIGVAVAECRALRIAGKGFTIIPTMILATGRTFIAMEDAADVYLVKRGAVYDQALRWLKDKNKAPVFSKVIQAVRENKPLPTVVPEEMVSTAKAILDPKLGNSATRIAWNAMWSPEAKAALVKNACIELGSSIMGKGVEGVTKSVLAERNSVFKAALEKIKKAEALKRATTDPLQIEYLDEVIKNANDIMGKSYVVKVAGVTVPFLTEEGLERGSKMIREKVPNEEE